jgi:FkbM family methyltransferase
MVLGTLRRKVRGMRPTAPQAPQRGPLAGMKMAVPIWMVDLNVEEPYEPGVTAALERLVRPGDVCLDLGAHVGYFTLLMARLAGPDGRVTAFEASDENARVVRRNIRLNRLDSHVSVEQAIVTDRSREAVELYAGRGGGSMEWTADPEFAIRESPGAERPKAAMRVRGVALDDFFPPGARVDVVKMDIEGAEAQAVPGMTRLLREARPRIVLEFHRDVAWPAIPALVEAGYGFTELDGTPLPVPSGADEAPYQLVAVPRAGL